MPSVPGVSNFPASIDDAISLGEAKDNASTTLTGSITATSLLIPVADPNEFPDSGFGTLTDSITPWIAAPTKTEIFRYVGKSGANLVVPSLADRGLFGTTAQSWNAGQFVEQRHNARYHTVLADGLIAAQAKLGAGSSAPAAGKELRGTANGSQWEDRTYTHDQSSAASTWTITHNLNCFPSIEVVD